MMQKQFEDSNEWRLKEKFYDFEEVSMFRHYHCCRVILINAKIFEKN